MVKQWTLFERACADRGWDRPAVFLTAFAQAAHMIGEPVALTDRQFRRWCLPDPPRPRAKAWRVLHAMFGINPVDLGFPPAPYGEINPCTFLILDQTEEKKTEVRQVNLPESATISPPGPLSSETSATGRVSIMDLLTVLETFHLTTKSNVMLVRSATTKTIVGDQGAQLAASGPGAAPASRARTCP